MEYVLDRYRLADTFFFLDIYRFKCIAVFKSEYSVR